MRRSISQSSRQRSTLQEGEISDELRAASSEHVDAFCDKVDRVAKLHQGSGRLVDAAQKETWRLENRRKAAENLKIRHNTCLWCPNKAISLSLSAADESLDRAGSRCFRHGLLGAVGGNSTSAGQRLLRSQPLARSRGP
jgi:hypothetical protein